jgi:hypothetical protein
MQHLCDHLPNCTDHSPKNAHLGTCSYFVGDPTFQYELLHVLGTSHDLGADTGENKERESNSCSYLNQLLRLDM